MKNEIITTQFNSNAVRMINDNGEVWFVAKDVCSVLGMGQKSESALRTLSDDEKLMLKLSASGQNRNMLTINESGLYRLILRSNKPQAKKFQKWVVGEVLPSIRKTGKYETNNNIIKRLPNGGYCVLGVDFIPYEVLINELKLSTNKKTMYTRRYKYPQMFLSVNNSWYVREDYCDYLKNYQTTKEQGENVRSIAILENINTKSLELFKR